MKRPIAGLGASLAAALVLSVSVPASAHDVWLTWSGQGDAGRALLNYGHPNDRPPAFAEKIVDFDAISAAGKISLLKGLATMQEAGASVIATAAMKPAGNLLVAARYDNGFWTTAADGEVRNVTKRSVPKPKDSIWSGKFAKLVTGPGAPWQDIVGHELELAPLSDPAAAKAGEWLRVKVLFQGKPLPRARIAHTDGLTAMAETAIPRVTAGADGVAELRIEKPGPQLLIVEKAQKPSLAPDQADMDLYNATLWFVVN